MRDNVTIEAVSNQSGDIPNQTGGILDALPDVPVIEGERVDNTGSDAGAISQTTVEKVVEKIKKDSAK